MQKKVEGIMENETEHEMENDTESGFRGLGTFANIMVPGSLYNSGIGYLVAWGSPIEESMRYCCVVLKVAARYIAFGMYMLGSPLSLRGYWA